MRIARFAVGDEVRYGIVDEEHAAGGNGIGNGAVAGQAGAGRAPVPAGRLTAARRARPG